MRPLKLGLLSFVPHVFPRNGIYYFRADIPTDLKQYLNTSEIKQSLKTREIKMARVLDVSLEYKVQRTYAMIRSGMLPDDIVQELVNVFQPRNNAIAPTGMKLSTIVEDYVKENEPGWTFKTKMEVVGCLRLISDVIGDVDVKTITKQMILDFRAKLMSLPANMYKIYPSNTVQQILELPDITPMSVNSVNKHILRLNALLGYAVKEGIIPTNYAQGMMLAEKRRADEVKKAYAVEDLQSIVSNLPRDTGKPERYWIPLIAMYSGLRLDEIWQLYVDDVQLVDGVWSISVNDEKDKKVKSESSKRIVAIHPRLISIGFIDYVEKQKISEVPRLWINLQWRKADGYSNAFGKWYQRFNRENVTDDPQKTFHSFRHLVANTLKQAGIQENVIAEIMGHANNSMTMGRYGKRYQPKVLLDALLKLEYNVSIPNWWTQDRRQSDE
jgi:integrase